MRNLDVCRAEVFRRSEERIERRRKQRKRALVCCVPLMLCVAVLAVIAFPRERKMQSNGGVPELMGGVEGEYSTVEIRGTGWMALYHRQISDAAQAGEIYDTVQMLFELDGTYSGGVTDGSLIPPAGTPVLGGGYAITFSDSGEVYTLSGKELTDEQTDRTVTLTDAQLTQLKELLGLAQ